MPRFLFSGAVLLLFSSTRPGSNATLALCPRSRITDADAPLSIRSRVLEVLSSTSPATVAPLSVDCDVAPVWNATPAPVRRPWDPWARR